MPVRASDLPRDRVAAALTEYGERDVVAACLDLLDGRGPGAVPQGLSIALGGRHARVMLDDPAADHDWWWRVWGARGLLYVWEESARDRVWVALDDDAWRVREGALRVIARRRLDDDPQRLVDLRLDPVRRVRTAAERALVRLEGT